MRVFTNNRFQGHWPVGTAAVVCAETKEEAAEYLNIALKKEGLGPVDVADMSEFHVFDGEVRVLCDGNY